jgi:uncharacterized protein (DUF2164 family)
VGQPEIDRTERETDPARHGASRVTPGERWKPARSKAQSTARAALFSRQESRLCAASRESTSGRKKDIFPMPIELNSQERDDVTHSLKKYFAEEMEEPLSDLRARLLLDYVLKEIAPLAYNRGVHDAEEFFRKQLEDLPATCFEPALTYWQTKRKK